MFDSHSPSSLRPYTQITIQLQGTRNTSRQALAAQLHEIAAQLVEGRTDGQLESEGAGYRFRTEVILSGPSIFSEAAEPVQPGSLRAAVSRQLGRQAVARLDEMPATHRAALERHFGFARQDSKKLRFPRL